MYTIQPRMGKQQAGKENHFQLNIIVYFIYDTYTYTYRILCTHTHLRLKLQSYILCATRRNESPISELIQSKIECQIYSSARNILAAVYGPNRMSSCGFQIAIVAHIPYIHILYIHQSIKQGIQSCYSCCVYDAASGRPWQVSDVCSVT